MKTPHGGGCPSGKKGRKWAAKPGHQKNDDMRIIASTRARLIRKKSPNSVRCLVRHRESIRRVYARIANRNGGTAYVEQMEGRQSNGGHAMMRRIAVVGDALQDGGAILPYSGRSCTFGDAGYQAALIGGLAYCEACKSVGTIAKTGGPRRIKFLGEVALDGDEVLCKCPRPQPIVAVLAGSAWHDDGGSASHRAGIGLGDAAVATAMAITFYDEQFQLKDRQGNPLSDTYYTVRLPNGDIRHGTTDLLGRTERIRTDAAQEVHLYIGHIADV
ncbi:PAAR domain-containing protein [Ralstonia pickettii]|uniref:PAAR domain-containing protein n=1 Tax=Ralstonia pickettii TaxID=329 RepID=UPI002115F8DB|nr:PAAR domain-containing protein [Ralstonia pickettii]